MVEKVALSGVGLLLGFLVVQYLWSLGGRPTAEDLLRDVPVSKVMVEHTGLFAKPEVVQVKD